MRRSSRLLSSREGEGGARIVVAEREITSCPPFAQRVLHHITARRLMPLGPRISALQELIAHSVPAPPRIAPAARFAPQGRETLQSVLLAPTVLRALRPPQRAPLALGAPRAQMLCLCAHHSARRVGRVRTGLFRARHAPWVRIMAQRGRLCAHRAPQERTIT